MNNQTYPAAFVKSLLSQLHSTRWTLGLALSASVSLLPIAPMANAGITRYVISWAGLGVTVAAMKTKAERERLQATAEDMNLVERKQMINWYNRALASLPTVNVQTQAQPTTAKANLVGYWLSQDKHMLVVGGTNAGKSQMIQAFASQLGASWAYQIYDCDCTVDDWTSIRSNPNTKMYETYEAIAAQMANDLATIETRTQERKEKGNTWNTQPTLTIAEEMPALVSEIADAGKWFASHAKRGRRVKRFVVAISQNDTVDNLGLRGDAALRDSCFVRVYLGKSAIARAKQLKNDTLVMQLEQGGYSVCLVDDVLYERPQMSYSSVSDGSQQVSDSRYFYAPEAARSAEATEAIEVEIVESGSEQGFSDVSTSPASVASPASTASVQQVSGYLGERTEASRLQEIERLLNTRLDANGWRLMHKWLPKNRLNASTPAKLAYAMRHLQNKGLALSNKRMSALVWGVTGGTSYSDICQLMNAIASTGIYQIT